MRVFVDILFALHYTVSCLVTEFIHSNDYSN